MRFPCSSLLSSCQPLSTTSLSLFISKQSRILPTGHDSYFSSRHGAITGIHWLLLSTRRPGSPRFHTQLNRPSGNLEFRSEKRLDGSSEFIFIPSLLFDLFFPPRTLQILAICRSLIQKQQASLTRCAYSRCLFLIISLMFHHCFSTGDGYYESSRYRFTSNGVLKFQLFLLYYALISPPGSHPTCITGVVVWVHGTYTLNPNGSITMKPFGDGFQQVQDPCAAVSNFIEPYNDIELYQYWRIFTDPVTGYHLHLYQFDGSPLPPQFQVSTSPNMLPTQLLRNATAPSPSNSTSLGGALQSSAENLWRPPNQWILGAMTAVAAVLIAI